MKKEKQELIDEIKALHSDIESMYKKYGKGSLLDDLDNKTVSQLASLYHELMNMLP